MSSALPMTFGSVLVLLAVISIHYRLSSDHTGATSLPLSITIPSSSPLPLAISLCTVCYHPISLFWRTMGVVVAMHPFFSSSSHIIDLLFRGTAMAVVPVTLLSIVAMAPLPSPIFCLGAVCVVISAPAMMGVVPPSPAIASIPALPVPVTVPVMLPGVPVLPGLLPSSFRRPAGFVAVPGLHHEWPVQVSLHVRMQVEGGGHSPALLGVELVEQSLTARPHVVSPQLVGPLLPN